MDSASVSPLQSDAPKRIFTNVANNSVKGLTTLLERAGATSTYVQFNSDGAGATVIGVMPSDHEEFRTVGEILAAD